jgi:hypothetical protein
MAFAQFSQLRLDQSMRTLPGDGARRTTHAALPGRTLPRRSSCDHAAAMAQYFPMWQVCSIFGDEWPE